MMVMTEANSERVGSVVLPKMGVVLLPKLGRVVMPRRLPERRPGLPLVKWIERLFERVLLEKVGREVVVKVESMLEINVIRMVVVKVESVARIEEKAANET